MNFILQGDPYFMVPLLAILITVFALIFKGLKNNTNKNIQLLKSIGLFALAFGVLGFINGMLNALEMIAIANSVSSGVLAVGFRVGLFTPTFGLIIFLVARLGAIALLWKQKEQ